jgi:hypothetical protein
LLIFIGLVFFFPLLQTERDVSVRQRAVDLLYAMCDRTNAEEIVGEMLEYLETADYSIREEMVRVVCYLLLNTGGNGKSCVLFTTQYGRKWKELCAIYYSIREEMEGVVCWLKNLPENLTLFIWLPDYSHVY